MKKVLFVLTLVVALAAVSIAQTKVLSGTWSATTNSDGYTLATNEGDRYYTVAVNFLDPFESKPDVILTVNFVDADQKTPIRYDAQVISATRDGMTLRIKTWGNTKLFGIGGYWMAHGE